MYVKRLASSKRQNVVTATCGTSGERGGGYARAGLCASGLFFACHQGLSLVISGLLPIKAFHSEIVRRIGGAWIPSKKTDFANFVSAMISLQHPKTSFDRPKASNGIAASQLSSSLKKIATRICVVYFIRFSQRSPRTNRNREETSCWNTEQPEPFG